MEITGVLPILHQELIMDTDQTDLDVDQTDLDPGTVDLDQLAWLVADAQDGWGEPRQAAIASSQ
jgi:hypothetical protein